MNHIITSVPRAGLLLALCFISYPPAVATAAGPQPATSGASDPGGGPPKTHVLFIGADIAVEKDKVFHLVEDVTATALVIKPGGKPVNVPLEHRANMQVYETLKIAATSVGISDLKTERAYTPGADPFRKFSQVVGLAAGQYAAADLARVAASNANTAVMGAVITANGMAGFPESEAMGAQIVGQAQQFQAQTNADLIQAYDNPGQNYDLASAADRMGIDESKQLFDAIRLSFAVTSEKDLAEPYCAIIAQIRERQSKPGQVRKWAYLRSLGPMRAGVPRKVMVYEGGLPPGYILEDCEVHLYDRGEELATSLSHKRVPITEEEALDFRVIQYVGANKGLTLPAAPAAFTRDLSSSLTPAQLGETCYVRVARNGRVVAACSDAAGKLPLQDPALEAALKTLRFKPALEAGKPVESTAWISLGKLVSP